MDNILIIGGGHVGVTLAVDLELRKQETGCSPHLILVRDEEHLLNGSSGKADIDFEDVISGQIQHCSFPKEHVHKLDSDLSNVLPNTRAIIITVPDIPSLRFRMIEWVKSHALPAEAYVVFVRGGQGGLIATINAWREDPDFQKFSLALVEDSFYGTRFIDNKVSFKRKQLTNVSVIGPRPDDITNNLAQLFRGPSIPEGFHKFSLVRPLDLQFDPLGYIIHLAVVLDKMNLQLTSQGIQYSHYCDGVHQGNADTIENLDLERVQMAKCYNASTRSFSNILTEQYNLPKQPTFLEMMKSTKGIYRSLSPKSIEGLKVCRLIHEDVPAMLVMEWLGRISGEQFTHIKRHVVNVREQLQNLGIKFQPHQHYVEDFERRKMGRSEVINLLTNPV
ncbi:NAD/NADP octopine/nopaline dehydrogenase family protein [Pseudovibrio sp. Tun.PSC04-5.I4]|uniref:NAD/NADP octopine/nopaline dehydrogenase family protein n=1 Tax=Pseudovibrio sp. Tun.PSC04-5.I4 TaxID=1798213 RepID=UPI00089182CD|nr:NAD/NADP octopine/nopaline dehydrogenase family protein [Pseudovibrio sp. Tun.PSC04-5.I4]SDR35218.1 opine dehydrogenase [Pseudovibrio sp. Tun.PSC04-5.I4]